MTTMLQFLSCSTCRVTMVEGGGNAASWSIFALLVIIVALLGCVGVCMVRIARREKLHLDPALDDGWSPDSSSR